LFAGSVLKSEGKRNPHCKEEEMASINCPVLGTWTNGTGKVSGLKFNADGTLDADTDELSFLVWETATVHRLVTLDNNVDVSVYDFSISGSTLTLTLTSGTDLLGGSYTAGTLTPGALSLSNDLLGGWTAVVTNAGMANGDWDLLYTEDGIVALEHKSMSAQFSCAYLTRDITSGGTTTHYLVTYGQMRFSSPVLGSFPTPSGTPVTTTVTELPAATPPATWDYTQV